MQGSHRLTPASPLTTAGSPLAGYVQQHFVGTAVAVTIKQTRNRYGTGAEFENMTAAPVIGAPPACKARVGTEILPVPVEPPEDYIAQDVAQRTAIHDIITPAR